MYESFPRGSGSRALRHEGTIRHLREVHQQEVLEYHAGRRSAQILQSELFGRITDERNLYGAAQELAGKGSAAGPDGITLEKLGEGDLWQYCRSLRDALREGSYQPGKIREVRIPKASGKGTRTLAIQNVGDRILGRAILDILQDVADPRFSEYSMGFRPRRGTLHALAVASQAMASSKAHGILTADIQSAFDVVPLEPLLDAARGHFGEQVTDLLRLVADTGRPMGIRQGSPLSPFLFNIFADAQLDQPWVRAHPTLPLYRYADDLLICTASLEEAQGLQDDLGRLCRDIGTPLKEGKGEIVDLGAGSPVSWLGYQIRRAGDQLVFGIAEARWERLNMALRLCHEKTASAPQAAVQTVTGWLGFLGPCLQHEDPDQVLQRIEQMGRSCSFEELPSKEQLLEHWSAAHARWQALREQIGNKTQGAEPDSPAEEALEDLGTPF